MRGEVTEEENSRSDIHSIFLKKKDRIENLLKESFNQ